MVQQSKNISQPSRKIRNLWVVVIVIFNLMIVSGILIAGLWPFNFLPENGCEANSKKQTLLFEKTGIAYRKLDNSTYKSLFDDSTFSLAFKMQSFNAPVYSATILTIYDNEEIILTIYQWKRTLIVQYGNDRVVFGNVIKEKSWASVKITIADAVLSVTCNDIPRKVHSDYLYMKNRMSPYIVFGNNASLHSAWKGELSSISINKSHGSFNLIEVPRKLVPLKARLLTPPWKDVRMERRCALDLIVNLIGFIPLGLSLCLLLVDVFSIYHYRYLVIMLSFFTSLFIETAQGYLITRTSQMSDLILNSWGGMLGVVAYVVLKRVIYESIFFKNRRSPGVH
jgi:VanZ family protein